MSENIINNGKNNMTARDLIEKYMKAEHLKNNSIENYTVLAVNTDVAKRPFWWHVHLDEEIPDITDKIMMCISFKSKL